MKLSGIVLSLSILLSFSLSAQQKDKHAEKYAKSIRVKDLKKHLNILASDEMGGRETGEESLVKASDYLISQFKEIGVPAVDEYGYTQFYKLEKLKNTGLAIGEKENFEYLEDFVALSRIKKNYHINDFTFVGYGNQSEEFNELKDIELSGKDVMILAGEAVDKDGNLLFGEGKYELDLRNDFPKKMRFAMQHKLRTIFVVYNDLETTIKPFKSFFKESRLRLKEEQKEDREEQIMPQLVMISKDMAQSLLDEANLSLDSLTNVIIKDKKPATTTFNSRLTLSEFSEKSEVEANNVLAYIEGSDLKDEVLVISAHFDHIGQHDGKVFNGADDDGSGTVALLEIAEAFVKAKKKGKGPRRSILILPVSGEEKGLLGSSYYASNPVFPLENTVANLNIDMIGRVDDEHKEQENYVYIIGSNMLSTDLHDLNEWTNSTYVGLNLDYKYNSKTDPNNYYERSDHYNFAKHNIPVIFYFNGTHADYHRETDTVDKINWEQLENRSRLVFYTAWHLANQDEKPELDVATK